METTSALTLSHPGQTVRAGRGGKKLKYPHSSMLTGAVYTEEPVLMLRT